jgi:hypothetical protein
MTDHQSAEYLERARARLKYARRRQAAWGWLILGPWILLGTALKVFSPHDYPAGDVRNEPAFWAALALVVLIFVGAILVSVVRYLRSTPPPTFGDVPPSRDTRER